MMMEHYFVLLELPGGNELRFTNGNKSPENFWPNAVAAIRRGNAKLICNRQDTGVSEALRARVLCANHFTTFLLANLCLEHNECKDQRVVMDKFSQWISAVERETVIDASDNYQLVTIDE